MLEEHHERELLGGNRRRGADKSQSGIIVLNSTPEVLLPKPPQFDANWPRELSNIIIQK